MNCLNRNVTTLNLKYIPIDINTPFHEVYILVIALILFVFLKKKHLLKSKELFTN